MKNLIVHALEESSSVKKQIALNSADKIEFIIRKIVESYKSDGKVLLIGNGGSAADAQHIAAEFVGRFKLERPGLAAIALTTDSSVLTAIGNDYGYETIFSRQIESIAKKGDVLIAISTSGNSPNVIKAVEVAQSMGVYVVGLTGGSGGKLKDISDCCVVVPSPNTPRIQEAHITIGHIICQLVEQELFNASSCVSG